MANRRNFESTSGAKESAGGEPLESFGGGDACHNLAYVVWAGVRIGRLRKVAANTFEASYRLDMGAAFDRVKPLWEGL